MSANKTILVVDDSRTNLGVLGRRLSALGYLPALCDSGQEALDLIAGRGFDLVLLDMVMPGLNGLHVLAEIRGSSEISDLPVIMVTARSDPSAQVEALAAGADDMLAKPFAFEVLAARINRVLHRHARIAALKRANLALDQRVATRAMELGEAKDQLARAVADRQRLIASIEALSGQITQLSGEASAAAGSRS